LKECLDHHESCLSGASLAPGRIMPPTRLIDVGPLDGTTCPVICNSYSSTSEWVTLSQCWGKSQPLRTTTDLLPVFQNSIPMESLPKLFQDAVTITRQLGFRFFMISAEMCHHSGLPILRSHVGRKYIQQRCHSQDEGLVGFIWAYPFRLREAHDKHQGVLRSRV
jgi:hypothetical protein